MLGKDRAIVDKALYADNKAGWQEWALTIQMMSAFKQLAFVDFLNDTGPMNDSLATRLDDWMAFIDDDTLAVSSMTPENHQAFEENVRRGRRFPLTSAYMQHLVGTGEGKRRRENLLKCMNPFLKITFFTLM